MLPPNMGHFSLCRAFFHRSVDDEWRWSTWIPNALCARLRWRAHITQYFYDFSLFSFSISHTRVLVEKWNQWTTPDRHAYIQPQAVTRIRRIHSICECDFAGEKKNEKKMKILNINDNKLARSVAKLWHAGWSIPLRLSPHAVLLTLS